MTEAVVLKILAMAIGFIAFAAVIALIVDLHSTILEIEDDE